MSVAIDNEKRTVLLTELADVLGEQKSTFTAEEILEKVARRARMVLEMEEEHFLFLHAILSTYLCVRQNFVEQVAFKIFKIQEQKKTELKTSLLQMAQRIESMKS